jgi:two-component system, OmpR family, phosphate regulon sensor histidine kinase PhoR
MLIWILEFLLAAALGAWAYRERTLRASRKVVTAILDEIEAGKTPSSFTIGAPLSSLSRKLESVDDALSHLRQQRRLSEANLHIILSSMQDGVLVADSRRNIRVVNPSLHKLLGLPQDVLGRGVLETLREPEVDEMIASALSSGKPLEKELETSRGGESSVLAVSVAPMRDASGEQGALVLFRDVTRLTRLEHVRRDFVANVSHELRTPLAIFQGWVENLQDNPDMPREDQVVAFSVLQKHSRRLNALVEDLLTLARLEASREELDRKPLDVPQFLQELVRDWTTRTSAKQVRLKLEIAPGVGEVSADRMRIEQVFTNLLDNAFKYSPEGAEIVLGAKRDGNAIELWVQDSGPGILSADLSHIFERFYRADKARSREHGGTGLGLSIVKHIVKAHGGEVAATSHYGKGTRIHVRLPID